MGSQLLALPYIAKGAVTASAANMTNAATAGFVDAAGKLTESGISALGQGAGAQVGDVLTSSMANKLGEKSAEAVAGAGGNVAKAGLSKLGSALAIA